MAISVPASIGTPVNGANGTTVALTTNVVIPAGAKVWIIVTSFDSANTVSGISDGGATVYTLDKQHVTGSCRGCIAQADYPSGLASGATITATFTGGGALDPQIAGFYSTGVKTDNTAAYSPLGAGTGTGTTYDAGAVTVANGDILIVCSKWEDSSPPTHTATGGNNELADWNNGSGYASAVSYQFGTGASIHGQGTWTADAVNGVIGVSVAYTAAVSGLTKAGTGIIGP